MWTRKELKTNAKGILKANYWKVFLATIIIALFTSASTSSSSQSVKDESQAVTATMSSMDFGTLLAAAAIIFTACLVVFLVSWVFKIFVANPFLLGAQKLILNCKDNSAKCGDIFFGFKNSYLNVAKTLFLRDLFIGLWSLLLVIPGIVKAYEYRMVVYLLAEHPDMSWKEAKTTSREMMNGQKWNSFVLDLSFIGWHILGVCTLGLVETFYTVPYMQVTNAELYYALKEN